MIKINNNDKNKNNKNKQICYVYGNNFSPASVPPFNEFYLTFEESLSISN